MMRRIFDITRSFTITAALLAMGSLGLTGCTITEGGQTLPSPYYLTDDVQYHPAGPEFKLAREAAALQAAKAAADATAP